MEKIVIAVLGAESTGKTQLCHELQAKLQTQTSGNIQLIPEALRAFCEVHQRTPSQNEQQGLMQAQIAQENASLKIDATILLCDCAPITTAIYSELYFGDSTLYPSAALHHARYTMSLVLDTDLPWQADGFVRDSPAMQTRFHDRLLAWVWANTFPYIVVTGQGARRTQMAQDAIMKLIR
jgi:nicotinamide riboside kinase